MTATNEQIIAEAKRRADFRKWTCAPIEYFIIEVVRENWTPPEPVDPDVLAFREWMAAKSKSPGYREQVLAGKWDYSVNAKSYLAGARRAREQEQERARPLVAYVEADARRLDGVGIRARATLVKYRGEA